MQDPLSQLRDLHVPGAPPWWPPAPGWWLLALVAFAAAAFGVWAFRRAYRQGAPRRVALTELETLRAAYAAGSLTALAYVDAVNALTKRLLLALGHRDAAPLSGNAWLGYLDRLTGSASFSQGPGAVLGNTRYEVNPQLDAREVHGLLVGAARRLKSAERAT